MFGINYASIRHQDLHYLEMDRNELPLEPCHLGVSLGTSQMISEPMVRLAQTEIRHDPRHLGVRNKIHHYPCHLGVPLGASKMIFEPMVRTA
jgi:hypothetical protein